MADLTTIRNALAAQITTYTGLTTYGQARDSIPPPCAVVLPGRPLISYGATMDGAAVMNLIAILLMSDGAPSEDTQQTLDAYLGIGAGETTSVAAAVMADPTLGHVVHYCEPLTVDSYGRVTWAGIGYFGARVNFQLGVI